MIEKLNTVFRILLSGSIIIYITSMIILVKLHNNAKKPETEMVESELIKKYCRSYKFLRVGAAPSIVFMILYFLTSKGILFQ